MPASIETCFQSRISGPWSQVSDRRYSPEQIAGRLLVEFPDDPEMRVSPETIYQSIYVQSRGALRRDLAVCLRTGRALRRPSRKPGQRKNRIPNMINIAERPAVVEDRAVPGNWEGDLIIGKQTRPRSALWSNDRPVTRCCCTCPRATSPSRSATRSPPRSKRCPSRSVVRRAGAARALACGGHVVASDRDWAWSQSVDDQSRAAAQPRGGRRLSSQLGACDGLPPGLTAQAGEADGALGVAGGGREGSGEAALEITTATRTHAPVGDHPPRALLAIRPGRHRGVADELTTLQLGPEHLHVLRDHVISEPDDQHPNQSGVAITARTQGTAYGDVIAAPPAESTYCSSRSASGSLSASRTWILAGSRLWRASRTGPVDQALSRSRHLTGATYRR
jgi:hypothetical protein